MYRSRDFSYMEVIHIKNGREGYIKDLLLDFNRQKIIGFEITSYNFINKKLNVMKDDIISFKNSMVINNTSKSPHLCFNSIKGMDIIDLNGNMIGMLEEILFEEINFKIYGVILSSGLMNNYLKGKRILIMEELVLGEGSILWTNRGEKLSFSSMPHKIKLMSGGDGNK